MSLSPDTPTPSSKSAPHGAAFGRDAHRVYDAAQLDGQYLARFGVPAFVEFVKRWQSDSAALVDACSRALDVPFGEGKDETLDIFHAAHGTPAPVLVFYHGGYWRSADKAWFRFIARPFVKRGAVVVLPNYSLCPSVGMDALVEQCTRSFEWLWRNVASFGGDESRVFVSGHSAAGHISGMLLAHDWSSLRSSSGFPIKGVTAISGLFDLEPIRLTSLNQDLRLTAESATLNSPVNLPLPARVPLISAAVGGLESDEFQAAEPAFRRSRRRPLMQHRRGSGAPLLFGPPFDGQSRAPIQQDGPQSDGTVLRRKTCVSCLSAITAPSGCFPRRKSGV
ncbi:alpha/beta hydrolase fold domain-containing protein [Rhizobium leguminosarum bv. viciae]|uniref:alpha/beta hydrolase n=1 Tax=Rhizobium leguminosarum TaxID=384 RepID=UPI0014423BAB|nr:alpha/beta hydrolase [Rhizobium leguminosarum]NKK30027.1 alpha/beta hydrolase fold domain-containing protein [Rhizobium leguminosarum bv. viciae]NKK40390.1 alpha/beta hydrolase fold domain-containing protein [Rhizobium leguminosarum bv. viciae]